MCSPRNPMTLLSGIWILRRYSSISGSLLLVTKIRTLDDVGQTESLMLFAISASSLRSSCLSAHSSEHPRWCKLRRISASSSAKVRVGFRQTETGSFHGTSRTTRKGGRRRTAPGCQIAGQSTLAYTKCCYCCRPGSKSRSTPSLSQDSGSSTLPVMQHRIVVESDKNAIQIKTVLIKTGGRIR